MKLLIFTLSIFLTSLTAFANCGDQICNVKVNGKTVALDVQWCSLGTQVGLSYEDANGVTHMLPSRVEPVSIVGGFWNDKYGFKLRFVNGGGGEIFNLQVANIYGRQIGRVTADLPGLKVKNARVVCPRP